MKKALLILGIPLALIALFGSLRWYAAVTGTKRPLTQEELACLVTAKDVMMAIDPTVAVNVTGERADLRDGITTLTTEYSSDAPPLYVVSEVTLDANERDARVTFQANAFGGYAGLSTQARDTTLETQSDSFSGADESSSQVIMLKGNPIGHFVVVRAGARGFMALFTGVAFSDHRALRALVSAKLEALTQGCGAVDPP